MPQFWVPFAERTVRQARRGEIWDVRPGVRAAWANSALPFLNNYYPVEKFEGSEELGEFFDAVVADAAGRGLPWLALVPNRRLNVLPFAEVDAIGQNRGLKGLMTLTEMVGDVRALTPARPPRPELEFERVETAQDVEEVLAVNIEAYGMPQEIAASAIEERLFFADPAKEIGFVGKVDGRAVSTATAVELDGWLYVALVATRPGEQRKGYADAVMRKALEVAAEELNITRTALDASEMGAPVYAGMGYAPTGAQWRVLMAE